MTDAEEDRIRAFAYRIWEEEGRPVDQAERHWEMAKKAIELEKIELIRVASGVDGPEKHPETGEAAEDAT
jgi:hypothetical protein